MNPLSALGAQPPGLSRLGDYLAVPSAASDAMLTAAERWTYAELRALVAKVSGGLQQSGVGPGDCVALLANPGPVFWIGFLATIRVGGVWLGLSPRSTAAELAVLIDDASPKLVLVDNALDTDMLPPDVPFRTWQDVQGPPLFEDLSDPGQPSLIVYTSGSTGRRKGALISQQALIQGARRRIAAWDHGPFRTLMNLPINHIGGVGDLAVTTLVSGGCLSFMPRFDAAGTLARIARDRLTFWYQVPSMFELVLAADDPARHNLSSLKAVCWSGAAASADLVKRLDRLFPGRLGTDYSQTESVGAVTIAPLGTDAEALIGSPGWPDPTRAIALADDGEVLVGADGCFNAYLRNPAATSETLRNGWLHTGDIGEWLPDGRLRLVGRSSDMFKSGGYNIYPREVEAVLEDLPGVMRAAIVGVPDALWGEVGHAWIQPAAEGFDLEAAQAELGRRLAHYKHPKVFHLIDEMPLLPIGKVDKRALQALAAARAAS